MSSRPSPSKSNSATPPPMLSTMYFFSGEEKLLKLMPAAFVTSTKVTSWRLEVVLFCGDASSIDETQRHAASAHTSRRLRLMAVIISESSLGTVLAYEQLLLETGSGVIMC